MPYVLLIAHSVDLLIEIQNIFARLGAMKAKWLVFAFTISLHTKAFARCIAAKLRRKLGQTMQTQKLAIFETCAASKVDAFQNILS